jgi:hypothetical protein
MARGRKPNVNPSTTLNLSLPLEIRTRLDLLLYSEVEERVPKGAYMKFISGLIGDFFTYKKCDFSHELAAPPGSHVIHARAETIHALTKALQGASNA